MSFDNIRQRRVATNGIALNIAEQGQGPLVFLLHGFPESWYSWRHQFAPLAAAVFHAVAPDMRGYGQSDKPQEISAYNQVEVVADIIGLIPALGAETAVVIGHDWGAPTAWSAAAQHPDRVRAVGTLSVPFSPRPESPPLDMLREAFKGQSKRMPERVPNLRANELLSGIGHWTQQEAPEAVNRLLVNFLRSLGALPA